MTKKMAVCRTMFLLLCLSSCSNYMGNTCPPRPAFTGSTYGDLVVYDKTLEDLYDSCAGKK
jgi:hypothetical protein